MMPRRSWSPGFSLIEVLVATGMVALALVAGLAASMTLTRYAERQPEVLLAQLCAQNALARLRLGPQWPDLGDSRSACEQAGREFEVRVSVQAAAQADFRSVRVQVLQAGRRGFGGAEQAGQVMLSLSTVIGRY
jgi:general secretion pathway protein I